MLKKATITIASNNHQIPVMYNPTELTMSQQVITTGEGANKQFLRTELQDLKVSLVFDSYEAQEDVRKHTRPIFDLTNPTSGKGARKVPPSIIFAWESTWFSGFVKSAQEKFTMFLSTGTPVRSRMEVMFSQLQDPKQYAESMGLFNCRQLYNVTSKDRLDVIAQKTLGDPAYALLVARTNRIYDVLNFPSTSDIGRTLIIPDIHGQA